MRFDGKRLGRRLYPISVCQALGLRGEGLSLLAVADMLDHAVAEHNVEGFVGEFLEAAGVADLEREGVQRMILRTSARVFQIDEGYVQRNVEIGPDPRRAAEIQDAQIGFDIHPRGKNAHASCSAPVRKGLQEIVKSLLPCMSLSAHGMPLFQSSL